MSKYTIAGYGKYKYVKKVSDKKAKDLEEKDKECYSSYSEAKRELERMKK